MNNSVHKRIIALSVGLGLVIPIEVAAGRKHFEFYPSRIHATMGEFESSSRQGDLAPGRIPYVAGSVFFQRNEWGSASASFTGVGRNVQCDPYLRASAWEREALCQLFSGQWKLSMAALDNALALAPRALVGEILLTKAAVAFDSKQWPLQEKLLAQATDLLKGADGEKVRFLKAFGHWRRGEWGMALSSLDTLPTNPAGLFLRGVCRRELGDSVEALEHFQRIIRDYPLSSWADRARFESGETYRIQGDDSLAKIAFEECAKSENPSSLLWKSISAVRLGTMALKRSDLADAQRWFSTIGLESENSAISTGIRQLKFETLRQLGNKSDLLAYADKWSRSDPRSAHARLARLWALADSLKFSKALSEADKWLGEKGSSGQEGAVLLIKAWCLDQLGKPQEALSLASTAIRKLPEQRASARAMAFKAQLLVRAGRLREAASLLLEDWNSLPEPIRQDLPEVEFWLGESFLAQQHWEESFLHYKLFLQNVSFINHPLSLRAHQGMCTALESVHREDEAESIVRASVDLAKKAKNMSAARDLSLLLGKLYFNTKDYGAAIEVFDSFRSMAENADTRLAAVLLWSGTALARLEDAAGARTLWEKLIHDYPGSAESVTARFRRAKLLLEGGDLSGAESGYMDFLQNSNGHLFDSFARFDLGQCLLAQGRFEDASVQYADFISKYPGHPLAPRAGEWRQLALLKAGRPPEVVEELTRGAPLSMALADAYWARGAESFNQGKYEDAIKDFEKIQSDFATSAQVEDAIFYRAESLWMAKRYVEAISAFRMLLNSYPSGRYRAMALLHLATCLFQTEDFLSAASVFESFARENPTGEEAPGALVNAGLCFSRAGKFPEAGRIFSMFLEKYPSHSEVGNVSFWNAETIEKSGNPKEAVKSYLKVPKTSAHYLDAVTAASNLLRAGRSKDQELALLKGLLSVSEPSLGDGRRINGLLRLGEIALGDKNWELAQKVYKDVSLNSEDEEIRKAAREQAEALANALKQ